MPRRGDPDWDPWEQPAPPTPANEVNLPRDWQQEANEAYARSTSQTGQTRQTSPTPTTPAPAPYTGGWGGGNANAVAWAAQQGAGIPGVPEWYGSWFKAQYGQDYYNTERGGPDQAGRDYQSLMNYWGDKTGRLPTPDEMTRFLTQFSGHAALLGRPATVPDMLNYATAYLTRPAAPQPVSYLRLGQLT